MKKEYCNPICKACKEAWETINGRYCGKLKRKVEYTIDRKPPCQEGASTNSTDK